MANHTFAALRSTGTWAGRIGAASRSSASTAAEWIPSSAQRTEEWKVDFHPGMVGIGLLVFIGYFLGAKIGFALTFHPYPVSVLWPPNSILLAALLLTPPRIWWFVILAAFPAHLAVELQSNIPPTMILCWFVSNSCEALIGAACIRYFLAGPIKFNRLRNVAIFCFCAAFLGTFLSSFLDAAFVRLNNWGHGEYLEIWRIRFTSNVLASLTVTPLILTWATVGLSSLRRVSGRRLIEASLLLFGLAAVSFTGFYSLGPTADSAVLFLPAPFLLWAAVRFGPWGASNAIFTVTFLAIWAATHGHGPFLEKSAEENARSIQMFLIVVPLPFLFLAALIEERAEAEEKLREREERIGLAAESANLALWTINFERGESWMSDNGRVIFNFAPDEPLTRELFLSRVHPEDRANVDEAIEHARAASEGFETEYRLLRPDGETRWLIARGRYLCNPRGAVSELIGVAFDVTAQMKANLQLRLQREELAHLGRVALMGELTGSLAHELNQPLTAIATNAAAGTRMLASGSNNETETFQELFADMSADARRAGNIIHGIHQFVRKAEGVRRKVNLNDSIRDVLRVLHSDLLGRATAVETELEGNLPAVDADPVLVQQALLNLVMNSLEAMQSKSVGERRIAISSAREGDSFVVVSVRDRGGGLPLENPDKIFTHFYSTKPNGMGMGLTIVRSIVESHHGELGAENVEGGARFFFRLPVGDKSNPREVA